MVTLEHLVANARRRVAELKRTLDVRELERRADAHPSRGFRRRIEEVSAAGPAVIAEIKKASPSKGVMRGTLHVAALALGFEQAGAAALSVLTEEESFQGSLSDLVEAAAASRLPVLRKDFIVDEIQILEAAAHGADAVLLIVAALQQSELIHLRAQAAEHELDALVEVHGEEELKRALDIGCNLIGVNSRDLKTFEVDLNTALRLGPLIPPSAVRVAESGIASAESVRRLRAVGYQGFLIGETLMRAESPEESLRRLIAESKAPGLGAMGVGEWAAGTKD